QRRVPRITQRTVVRTRGKGVIHSGCHDEVAMLGVSRCDAVLDQHRVVAETVGGGGVVLDVARWEPVEFEAIPCNDAAAAAVAIIYGLGSGGSVLVGKGEAVVLRQARFRLGKRGGPGGLQLGHLVVMREEALFD